MIYIYTCKDCDRDKEVVQPITDNLPDNLKCEKCNGVMFHNIRKEARGGATIIPNHMRAEEINKPSISYDKSPSRRKHFW